MLGFSGALTEMMNNSLKRFPLPPLIYPYIMPFVYLTVKLSIMSPRPNHLYSQFWKACGPKDFFHKIHNMLENVM